MAEYIERETLRKILKDWRDAHADADDEQGCGLLEDVIWEVDAQPAADVAPVVHGWWAYHNDINFWQCSVCGVNAPMLGNLMQLKTNYCPNCGAMMDGGSDL